ncbi:hypothetical protein AAFF_G00271180, partial [Aldrovandia affinis]
MRVSTLACAVLCLLTAQTLAKCVLQNYTLYAERKDCGRCVAINTTICSGFCFSRDTNVRERGWNRLLIQRGCAYRALAYRAVKMPGCPATVDPFFSYPVALRCHCSHCNTTNNECLSRDHRPSPKCSKAP